MGVNESMYDSLIGSIMLSLKLIFLGFFNIQRVNRIMKCEGHRVQQPLLKVPLIEYL